MRIGQLAARAGVSLDTVRYYERIGLVRAARRTAGGFREYDEDAAGDLGFIRKAQASGLKLKDIGEILDVAAGGRPPCQHVRTLVHRRLAEVEGRIAELRTLRTALKQTLGRLETAPPSQGSCRCAAIEGSRL